MIKNSTFRTYRKDARRASLRSSILTAWLMIILASILQVQAQSESTQQAETRINAQFLSAEQVVGIALEKNYQIRLSLLNESILQNNRNLGVAEFLPDISADAATNNSITNTRQEYLSGQVNERNNAKSSSLNAGIGLDWTLFDGFRMFAGYDILKQQLEAGKLQTRLEIENTIAGVLSLYYNIVELRQKIRMFEQSVALGKTRVDIADNKLTIGAGSRLELLQARVDMNADISELVNLNDLITEATVKMNLLLAREPDMEFAVEDTIVLLPLPEFPLLKQQMEQANAALLLNRSDLALAEMNLRVIKGRRYPEIGINMAYNYNKQESESGFVRSGRSDGINYGVTASIPIFEGLTQLREQKNARIAIESAQLQNESFLAELNGELVSTYSIYNNKLKTINLERENLSTAYTNFDIANERYRLGELSGIEIREAQQNFLLAQDRLITLIYQARLLEIELMQLTGKIIP